MSNTDAHQPAAAGSPVEQELGLYRERDHAAQGKHYLRHLDAMTREGLHAKSRIAGELAARDIEIERLRAALDAQRRIFRAALLEEAAQWTGDYRMPVHKGLCDAAKRARVPLTLDECYQAAKRA